MKSTVLLQLSLAAFTSALLAFDTRADDPPPPAGDSSAPATVIVPYDSAKPAGEQHPDGLYVPYEQFLQLWDAAKAHRRGPEPAPAAPVDFTLSHARYDGRVGEHAIAFTGTLDLLTGQRWAKIPLAFADARIKEIKLDGEITALQSGAILVENPGRHEAVITFEVERPAGDETLSWGVPPSTAAAVTLTFPLPGQTAAIEPGAGAIERVLDGARAVTAALGATDRITVKLHPVAPPTALSTPASATVQENVAVSRFAEETIARITFAFPGSRQDHFNVTFPLGLTLLDLGASNLHSWALRSDADKQTLELTLNEPAEETFFVRLVTHRPLPMSAGDYTAPLFTGVARRSEQTALTLSSSRASDISVHPSEGLRQIEPQNPESLPDGFHPIAAFAGNGLLAYHRADAPSRVDARINYLYQLNRKQIELFASIRLIPNGDPLMELSLDLPPGFSIESIQSNRLHDWWRDGDRLLVRFQGQAQEETPLVAYLVKKEPKASAALDLQPLKLAGVRKVTGETVVAAHKSVDAALELHGDAREIGRDRAAQDYEVLAPLERKRGFSFTGQDFSGRAVLTPVPAKYLALSAVYAAAHEGWMGLSAKVRFTLRQGSLNHARFTLPAALPEARVSGNSVRETRSQVKGDRRVYDLEFQRDIIDETEFTIDLEAPLSGKTSIPSPEFPDAQRSTGYVVADNPSEGEMSLATEGVDPAPPKELPWLPTLSRQAKIFRIPAGPWSVRISVEQFAKAAGRRAFCAWAELNTALRADGTEWHRAVWHLQNRALQFLPVHLPAAAELISVRVAGESVRADAETIGGKSAILIPLIKTKPGELSYEVEAVFRVVGPPLRQRRVVDLHDPELLGITVERTFWNVSTPPQFSLRKLDGNMEPVIQEIAETEKLDTTLEELKSLTSILNSASVGSRTRAVASDNLSRLKATIEEATVAKIGAGRLILNNALDEKAAHSQWAYADNRKQAVARELQAEVKKYVESEAAHAATPGLGGLPQPTAQPTQSSVLNRPNTNWVSQAGRVTLPTQAPAAAAAPTNNVYLNDNIVLRETAGKAWVGAAPPSPTSGPDIDMMNARPAGGRGGAAPQPEDTGGHAQVLRTARGNAAAQSDQYSAPFATAGKVMIPDGQAFTHIPHQISLAGRIPAPPMPSAAAVGSVGIPPTVVGPNTFTGGTIMGGLTVPPPPAAQINLPPSLRPPTTGAEVPMELAELKTLNETMKQRGEDDKRELPLFPNAIPAAPGAASPAFAAGAPPPPPPKAPSLSEGRITIAVDFPTESEPLHFKKIKGAARLSLSFTAPSRHHPWRNAAWLAVAAVVLRLLQRRLTRAQAPYRG